MSTNPSDDIFLTVDDSGNPVDKRIVTTTTMRDIFSTFLAEDAQEADRRVRLSNIYNGYLPYKPEDLRKLNLGNLANFNTGDLAGFIDARVAAISELALDTSALVELRPLPASNAGPQAATFAEIIADEFSTTVRDRNKLLPCLAGMFRECDLFGLGPVTWASSRDYNPMSLRRGQIKFRSDGPINSSDHEIFMFESPVDIGYFRRLFSKPEVSKKAGWNVQAVKDYLIAVYIDEKVAEAQAGNKSCTTTQESAQLEMRQNRWLEINQFKTMTLLHALVKESDGKIRHQICTPMVDIEPFLFDKEACYESFDQCFLWMPASVVEQEARGSRGVASKIAPLADLNNRLLCQMYDVAFRAGAITLVSTSPGMHQQQTISERGPWTVIPADLAVSPQQFNGSAIQQLASLRDLGNNISSNNVTGTRGAIGGASERIVSGTERKTKQEVMTEEDNKARGEQVLFAARVLVLDAVFRETFRRFMLLVTGDHKDYPEVEKFIQRCILRGIPLEVLKNTEILFTVYTSRILVTGGGAAHAAVLSQLMGSFGGNFDEMGRNLMTRDIVRFRLGTKSADRYRPESSRDNEYTNATSFAVLENNSIQKGDQAIVGSDQMHWSHVPIHMQILSSAVQMYKENPEGITDPQQMLNVLQIASQHIQEHVNLGAMQPGMQPLAKSVISQIASLAPVIKGLTMMAATMERQQQAEAKRQQEEMAALQQRAEGNEAAVEMHKSDNKAALAAREQDLLHEARMKGVELKGQADLAKAGSDARRNIANQTARVEQGGAILGRGEVDISPVE